MALFALSQAAYDGVVTDLHLPGMSGLELARRLRGPRLIALSGDLSGVE